MIDNQSIIAAYQQYLGRTPHANEVSYWAGSGRDLSGIQNAIVASPEYQNTLSKNTTSRFIYGDTDGRGGPDLINNQNFREFVPSQDIHNLYSTNRAGGNLTPADIAKIDPNYSNVWNNLRQPGAWNTEQKVGGLGGLGGTTISQPPPVAATPAPQQQQQPSGFDMDAFFNRFNQAMAQNQPQQQAQPQQFDPTPYFNAFQQQQSAFMDKWADMAGMNKPKEGVGSGQWGNFGGNTSPVYRPNQGNDQARNGWGGPWSQSNPFAPTL